MKNISKELIYEHIGSKIPIFILLTNFKYKNIHEIMNLPDVSSYFNEIVFDSVLSTALPTQSPNLSKANTKLIEHMNAIYVSVYQEGLGKFKDSKNKDKFIDDKVDLFISSLDRQIIMLYKTPARLVNEKLDNLPLELWLDPYKTWADFCCGTGEYVVQIARRLLKSLPAPYNNMKHIIENMIYFNDINSNMLEITKFRLDFERKYIYNSYCDDFLFEKITKTGKGKNKVIHHDNFEYRNNLMGKKFDVIVGNPPFQKTTRRKLWPLFIHENYEKLKLDGYLVLVSPSNFLNSNNSIVKRVFKILQNNNTIIIDNNINDYFNLGIDFSYFIAQKGLYKGKTRFNHKTLGEVIFHIQNEKLPKDNKELLTETICDKIYKKGNFIQFTVDHLSSADVYTTKTDETPYFVIQTTANTGYTGIKLPNMDVLKVAVNISSSYKNITITTDAVGGLMAWVKVFSMEEAENLKSYLLHPALQFYAAKYQKTSGFTTAVRRSRIPKWDGVTPVYDYFNLTEKEIKHIEEIIK